MATGDRDRTRPPDADRETYAAARRAAARLTALEVTAVALTVTDTAGVVRAKAVPVDRLADAAVRGVGISPVFDVFTSADAITATADLGGPDGDLRLVPDLGRLTVLAAQPGWAWAPADRFDQLGTPHPGCSRHFLRRTTAAAHARGLRVAMGYETEWVALRPGPDGHDVPAFDGPAYGMSRLVAASDYLRDIVSALRAQDVAVRQVHPEYAPGQFEVSTAPADPLAAADDVVLVRETVRAVSHAHGLTAAFAPAIVAGQVGNGCHLHFSLTAAPAGRAGPQAVGAPAGADEAATGEVTPGAGGEVAPGEVAPGSGNEVAPGESGTAGAVASGAAGPGEAPGGELLRGGAGPHGLTPDGEAFLAGVLDALPALLAVGAPSPASYLRLGPSRWAGAYQCWGLENREAALRLVSGPPGEPGGAHAEVKCCDAAANPYLLAGAVLAAGLAGLEAAARLPAPVRGDPAVSAPGTPRLPRTLTEAADHLAAHDVLRAAFGPVLHDAVLAVRRAEEETLAGRSPQDVVAATLRRY
ncbi:glutamine synthetase family protein [Streptomyces sp. SL13]|uniref:Glutamine synthetase family protein n=1 Tax=Streptantibioticus silvisoli TaxID=2705255 RepID=A0AA90H760_9ACTN|nr:glutamine synthetase family protein [Streptantibioticus silvisoli]MDI5973176.1 glutamine synthetase family protein [Streptantibioticus silvisoli]